MEQAQVKELKIYAEEKTAKEKGNKFLAFKTVGKDGKFLQVRFRKEAKNIPTTEGVHRVVVKVEDLSIDNNREYPRLWVHDAVSCKPWTTAKVVNIDEYI